MASVESYLTEGIRLGLAGHKGAVFTVVTDESYILHTIYGPIQSDILDNLNPGEPAGTTSDYTRATVSGRNSVSKVVLTVEVTRDTQGDRGLELALDTEWTESRKTRRRIRVPQSNEGFQNMVNDVRTYVYYVVEILYLGAMNKYTQKRAIDSMHNKLCQYEDKLCQYE